MVKLRVWCIGALLCGASTQAFSWCFPNCASQATSNDTITATLQGPLSIVKNKDLVLGTVVRPSSGSYTATLQVTTAGVRSFSTGGTGYSILSAPAASAAQFTISGTASAALSLTVPTSVTLNGPSSSTLVLTLTTTGGSAIGSGGTLVVSVGATVPLTATSTRGAYTGTMTVSASYN